MILSLKNASKSFANGSVKRKVLNNVSLELAAGESIAIVGPSGCGKTTLLNILGTLDSADNGELIIGGNKVSELSEKDIAKVRNKKIGFVFQLHHLLPQCTLLENVLIPTLPNNENKAEEAESLLRELGVWSVRNQKPGELSGGECQRAAVARALINHPDLILADEPTGALDEENAGLLMDLLLRLQSTRNMALVVVTHSTEIASKMSKVFRLHLGELSETSLLTHE